MKNIIIAIALLAFTFAGQTANADTPQPRSSGNTEIVVYDVNINCGNCKAKLERHIPFEKGVKDMIVDIEAKQVTVKFDKRKTDSETVAKAIEDLGYTVTVADPEE